MAALKKVRPGDPLVIPATTFNAFVDAARDIADRRNSAQLDPGRDYRQADIVLIRNDSGADRARCEVLGIAGPIVKPGDNTDVFKERVALKGVSPGAEHVGRFAILLEPLVASAVGRACVAGVCVVKVKMNDEAHTFAEVKSGQTTMLDSAASGTACLLWIQPSDERENPQIAWTVARLGGGGGSPGAQWAKVKSVDTSTFTAKLLDASGDETGEEFTVRVLGATANGYTPTPALADCMPQIVVGDIVRVATLQAAGSIYPEGYWLTDLVFETCY
jgi:hypothetical protein